MKISKIVFLLIVLFCLSLTSVVFSNPKEAHFNVSTPKIFGPKDSNIYVNLSSKGVRYVDIAIYKLKDPLKFILHAENKQNLRTYEFSYKLNLKREILNSLYERLNDLQKTIRIALRKSLSYETRKKIKNLLGIDEFKEFTPPEPPLSIRINKFLRDEEVIAFFREYIPKPKKKDWWSYKRIDLPIREVGTYLVEVAYEGKTAYTLVMINNISIAIKTAAFSKKLLVFAEDKYTSLPLMNASIYIMRGDKVLAKGKTDENGLFLLKNLDFSLKNLVILANYNKEITMANSPYIYYERENLEVYTYTDRPIYKPGNVVYYKSIIRVSDIFSYALLSANKKAKIIVRDPYYNVILEEEKSINKFGTLSGKIDLTEDAIMGYYTLSISIDGVTKSTYFQVEEYEKPEFTVKVDVPKEVYKEGETLKINISAKYYFGEPLRDGKVRYRVTAYPLSDYYSKEESFLVKEGNETLNENGEVKLLITQKELLKISNSTLFVEVYVYDWKNKMVYGSCSMDYIVTDFLLSIDTEKYVYNKNETVKLKIEAFDIEKNPVTTKATIIVKHFYWRKNKRIETIEIIDEIEIVNGKKIYMFKPKNTGPYKIEVNAHDKNSNKIVAYDNIWISGTISGYRPERIRFIIDKNKYKMGETIRGQILLPEEGVVGLYTLEGKDLYEYKVIKTNSNYINLNIPLTKSYIGPIKINFLFFSNGKYYNDYKILDFIDTSHRLDINIITDKKVYKPGEKGIITVEVKDVNGKGVKAELSLGVVDESIYALTHETNEDIFDYFYTYGGYNYYNSVTTSVSYYYRFYGNAFDESIMEALKKDNNPLADFKEALGDGGAVPPVRIRRFFPDTPYFNPHIVTDKNGKARIEFTIPDSLTSFRITVKAITTDTKVGENKENIIVKKDVFSRMGIPPFAIEGDEVSVLGVVHNYTDKDRTLKLKICTDEKVKLNDNKEKFLSVSKGHDNSSTFDLIFQKHGLSKIRLDVIEDNYTYDALLKEIKVLPYGYHINTIYSGVLKDKEKTIYISFPVDTKKDTVSAWLEIDTSIITTLIPSFKYLIGYPYGCTEQTMSKLLPDIAVKNLLELYNLNLKEFDELDKMIIKGIRRLYKYQHGDGGWGWWENDESTPIQTAYVVFGLNLLKENGYMVSNSSINRAYRYLMNIVNNRNKFDSLNDTERSFTLYILSTWKGLNREDKEFLKEIALSLFGNMISRKDTKAVDFSYIAMAFKNLGLEDLYVQTIQRIKDKKIKVKDYIYWPGYSENQLYITDMEATAWVGFALLSYDTEDAIMEKIVQYLIDFRTGDNWINTKSTAISLLFLGRYLQYRERFSSNYDINVYVGDKDLGKFEGEGNKTIIIPLKPDDIIDAETIKVKTGSKNIFYYRIYLDYWKQNIPPDSILNLQTKYFKAIPHLIDGKYLFSKESIDDSVNLNDIVVVEITFNSQEDLYNVILEIPRPAGFEYIKDEWNYNFVKEKEEKEFNGHKYYGYKEYRKDKVVYFLSYIPKGLSTFRYLARAREIGKFNILPAHLTLMYKPDMEGFGEKYKILITK